MTLHPNMGLTFDLQRIRQALPGRVWFGFVPGVGLSETISDFIDTRPELRCGFCWMGRSSCNRYG